MGWGRRKIVLSALLVLVAVVLGSTVEAQAQKRGGMLRIANVGEPPTLDYSATTVGVTSNISMAIFETPFAFDASWRPQPMLVESHSVSADGRTHTFKLGGRALPQRQGDDRGGRRRVAHPLGQGRLSRHRGLPHVEAVTTPDKYTVVMQSEGALRALARLPGPAVLGGVDHAQGDRRGDAGRAGHRVRRHRTLSVRGVDPEPARQAGALGQVRAAQRGAQPLRGPPRPPGRRGDLLPGGERGDARRRRPGRRLRPGRRHRARTCTRSSRATPASSRTSTSPAPGWCSSSTRRPASWPTSSSARP